MEHFVFLNFEHVCVKIHQHEQNENMKVPSDKCFVRLVWKELLPQVAFGKVSPYYLLN